jgi:hypothetical protein
MTTDDERIAHLGGDGDADRVPAPEGIALDETRALLADPSLWAEPASRVEDAVVAAVVEAAAGTARPDGPPRSAEDARAPGRRRRRRPARLAGAAAVAALVAAVGLVVATVDGARPGADLEATLQPTGLVPGAAGHATFVRTDSGWRIDLDATGLPRLDDGRLYQAWLRDDAGVLVTIGTFNEPHDVVLWAGVSPVEFSTITVTEEPVDDDPTSTGRRVLVGAIRPDDG